MLMLASTTTPTQQMIVARPSATAVDPELLAVDVSIEVADVDTAHEIAAGPGSNEASGSLLDEIVRDGARQMLATALQAEVAAYIEAHADQVDGAGRRLVVRNGHHQPREVTTAAGAVSVRAPRVNDKRTDEVTGPRPRLHLLRRARHQPARRGLTRA